jgi:hypothetical protein
MSYRICLSDVPSAVYFASFLHSSFFQLFFLFGTRNRVRFESELVLGKSLHFGILSDPNPNPAFNRILTNQDPGTLERGVKVQENLNGKRNCKSTW